MISIFRKLIPGSLALGLAVTMLSTATAVMAQTGFPCVSKFTSPAPLTVEVVLGPCTFNTQPSSSSKVRVVLSTMAGASDDLQIVVPAVYDQTFNLAELEAGVFATFTFNHAAGPLQFSGNTFYLVGDQIVDLGSSLDGSVVVQSSIVTPKPVGQPTPKPTVAPTSSVVESRLTAVPPANPTANPSANPSATPAVAPIATTSSTDGQNSSLVGPIGLCLIGLLSLLLFLLRPRRKDKELPVDPNPPLDFYGFGYKEKD